MVGGGGGGGSRWADAGLLMDGGSMAVGVMEVALPPSTEAAFLAVAVTIMRGFQGIVLSAIRLDRSVRYGGTLNIYYNTTTTRVLLPIRRRVMKDKVGGVHRVSNEVGC